VEVHAPPLNSFLFAAGALTERVDSLSHGDDLSVRDRNGTAGDGVDRARSSEAAIYRKVA
jgi:hypothetical protein